MNLKALLLLQPGRLIRSGVLALCVLITLLVGYLHTLTGLSYEFHVSSFCRYWLSAGSTESGLGMGWRCWLLSSGSSPTGH
jgi:hypothetical protein